MPVSFRAFAVHVFSVPLGLSLHITERGGACRLPRAEPICAHIPTVCLAGCPSRARIGDLLACGHGS